MKKVLISVVLVLSISFSIKSQSVCALGNYILERNDFIVSRNILQHYNFSLFAAEDLKTLGFNPNIKIIATKGNDPANSMMVTVNGKNNGEIEKAVIICNKNQSIYLDKDLTNIGYKITKEKEYIEDGRFKITEIIYQRDFGYHIQTVIAKFGESGEAEVTFKAVEK